MWGKHELFRWKMQCCYLKRIGEQWTGDRHHSTISGSNLKPCQNMAQNSSNFPIPYWMIGIVHECYQISSPKAPSKRQVFSDNASLEFKISSQAWFTSYIVLSKMFKCQGTMGCTPNSVPMVFIVFSRDSWG